MASRGAMITLIVGIFLTAGSMDHAIAQPGCTAALTSLAPCLTFITGNTSMPSSSCCLALSSVVQSSPRCLCSALNGNGLPNLGFTINQTQALQLPRSCNIQTPPVSQCNAASGPTAVASGPISSAASPVSAPVGPPAESTSNTPRSNGPAATPSAGTSPSGTEEVGGGKKATPSAPAPANDGVSSINGSLQLALLPLIVAAYWSVGKTIF
ncbi:hypothetical protein SAY87_006555 [Trapa incisa]|uniref:Bifunctional inhibitor/plant lipid transfer protein/seed storage helical domain-containing protein n=1 Tax=Trapa incisa TaxID=236973 RepID=A0AAN7K2V5_9MYRT|nr:hypothetical protein SAY87_006555 [Trapa incisa]